MNKDLVAIFEYLEREKGIKREVIISDIDGKNEQEILATPPARHLNSVNWSPDGKTIVFGRSSDLMAEDSTPKAIGLSGR